MRFYLKILSVVCLLLVVGMVAVYSYCTEKLQVPLNISEGTRIYHVVPGAGLSTVASDLERKGIIESARLVSMYGRYKGYASKLKAGEYRLRNGMSLDSFFELLTSGNVVQYSVTLIEGHTFSEFRKRLADSLAASYTSAVFETSAKQLDEFSPENSMRMSDEEIMAELGAPGIYPEGYFLPETYHFIKGATEFELLQRAYNAMQETLHSLWAERAKDLPYETPYDALIMASIIEKETGIASEREQIAGVFVRRLQKRMRLQTDPTVIYGLGDDYKGNLTRKHLKMATPYNTYMIRGLPPTPIANPSKSAIFAALHPAEGTELYFVAKGDGSHHFSSTLKEHQEAVRKYQLRRRSDYRSKPSE